MSAKGSLSLTCRVVALSGRPGAAGALTSRGRQGRRTVGLERRPGASSPTGPGAGNAGTSDDDHDGSHDHARSVTELPVDTTPPLRGQDFRHRLGRVWGIGRDGVLEHRTVRLGLHVVYRANGGGRAGSHQISRFGWLVGRIVVGRNAIAGFRGDGGRGSTFARPDRGPGRWPVRLTGLLTTCSGRTGQRPPMFTGPRSWPTQTGLSDLGFTPPLGARVVGRCWLVRSGGIDLEGSGCVDGQSGQFNSRWCSVDKDE